MLPDGGLHERDLLGVLRSTRLSQYQELIDLELLKMGAWLTERMTPQLFAEAVTMPVFMHQFLDDAWTRNPEDAQKTFDLLAIADKELF